jgi:FRG domain
MNIVEIVDCTGANEFLDQLSPRGPRFVGTEAVGSYIHLSDAWVFRGHSEDEYQLTPSALRNTDAFAKFGTDRCDDNTSQIMAEMDVLRRFFNLADATGLPLPEDSQVLRASIQRLFTQSYFDKLEKGEELWPPLNLWSLLGIAQHYGIPTRLMDWTRRAKVAAYFAASEAAAKLSKIKDDERIEIGEKKKLCVWAFAFDRYVSFYNPEHWRFFGRVAPPDPPVVKVTAPHAHNPNLHAQDGLFSLQMKSMKQRLSDDVDRSSLEAFLQKTMADDGVNSSKLFYRIRLRWSEATHLMWRLRQDGIGHATIYPGYGGVVGALKEEHAL